MLQLRTFLFHFIVSMRFVFPYENKIPFHLRFNGGNSQGLKMIYQQYNVTFETAINLCSKVCKEHWWCIALRKCADRPELFQCDVVCQLNTLESGKYTHGNERCVSVQVDQMGPNVAARKTVRVISGAVYRKFHPEYATDTLTICPRRPLRFLHTIFTKEPWIEVVLGQSVSVSMVVIYNRQTHSGHRFHNALIEVAENNVWRPCGFYKGPGVNYQIIFVICDEAIRGDILKITLKTEPGVKSALHLCEVEVFDRVQTNTSKQYNIT